MSHADNLPPIAFSKTTLPNGLDVIARRDPKLPIVAVNLWYHVGSKNEERRQRGFAHLFEHLMFEGSEHYPGDFFKPLQRLGAGINGSTSADRTNYYVDLPVAHLELAMAMESDRMGHLVPALSDAKIRVQKDVVKNEYRQNYANRPYGQAGRLMFEALYPPTHSYSWLTIGEMEEVEAASRDDVVAFFQRFYVPANASLSIVGDLETERAIELAHRYFGDIPGGCRSVRPWTPEVQLAEVRHLRQVDRVELDRIYESWHTVPQFAADDAPLTLLADVLGRGRSSRLYRKLVRDLQVAQGVSVHHGSRELAGTFGVVVTLRPGQETERVRTLVLEEVAAIAEQGITEEEFARVRNGRHASFVYALDNVGGFGGVADRLNAYNVFLGDPGRITGDLQRYLDVQRTDLPRVARRYLVDAPRVALDIVGSRSPALFAPIDRSQRPESLAAVPYRAPKPEVRTLGCGASAWFLPRKDLPIVAVTAVLRAGTGSHGPEQGGLAYLTAGMLDEGTLARSAEQIAQEAEGLGTALSTTSGYDGSYVSFQCLSRYLPESLELAVDVLLHPSFPAHEWERVQAQTLASIRSDRDSAEARAHRAFLRRIYAADHPYRLPTEGEEASVGRLGREDLVAFHRGRYRPDQAAWVVAGDVEPDEIMAQLEGLLTGWAGPSPAPAAATAESRREGPSLVLLDRPGAPQAVVRVGHLGLPRSHPDHADVVIFNQILGGQFSSRLNETLREAKGYTYGVRSHFDFRRDRGPFSISASLESDRLAEALGVLREEVMALLDARPPSRTEVEDARRSLIEGQSRHFENPSALVSRFAGLFVQGLPTDEHSRLAERLDAVTLETALEAGRRHIRPESFTYVVVADAGRVAPELARLPWARLETATGEEGKGLD